MKPETIYQGCFWLLGFTVAFFAFVARDRRMPSVSNTIYSAILITFFAALLAISSGAVDAYSSEAAKWLLRAAAALLTVGVILVLFRVWKAHHRHIHFRDDQLLQHIWVIRKIKEWRRARKYSSEGPDYRHKTTGITDKLLSSILESKYVDEKQLRRAADRYKGADGTDLSLSIACHAKSLVDADELMVDLAVRFLEDSNCTVQYGSCVRHPFEFLLQLKSRWQSMQRSDDWKQVTPRIVAVDAYTSHFGFTDSIHPVFHHKAKLESVEVVPSPPTYAGVHTAAMRAFNITKERAKKRGLDVRTATLVIYECPYALSDLESPEQYRIFVRHVLPSERLWGGMLTIVVESGAPKEALDTLRAYVDLYMDLDEPRPVSAVAEVRAIAEMKPAAELKPVQPEAVTKGKS